MHKKDISIHIFTCMIITSFIKKSQAFFNILLKIGNLDNLTTTNTTNLVEAINELKLSNDMLASSFANALEELGKLVGGDL